MTNRMDYIHRKSRGRALNESMLNEAVYNMKDVREMWYKKIKLLSDPRKQINLHAKLSKIEPGLRDAELAKILLHNFPGTSPGFINSIISSTFGDPDWLEILNTRFGTNIDMDYLKSCFARMRGPELDQKTLQAIGKKEDAFIKQIESGRGNTKSEEVMKVAASTKRTYIAGSFEEVYELVTTRNDFERRYEKNPDGTISINMADIPLTMVRAMYGLRAVDDSQPLVYIVFGPNGGNDKVIKDHAKQELDLFLRNSHEEKELQEMHIGYYDLRPCGLEYWWTNVSKRFVSKKDNEAVDKVRNSNATLVLSRDGECVLMTEGFESEPEIDPAVNPGNVPVTAPIEDEYGFDTVKESMDRHYSRTLNEAVVSFYKPVSEIAFKWLLWRTKKEGVNVKIKKVDENNESYIKFYINDKQCGYYELSTKKLVYDQDCKELVRFIKILHEMEEALAHGFIISDFNEPNYSKGQTSNEPDYSKFESMQESKNNDIRMNRYNRNWARPESARLRRFAGMLESIDTRHSRHLNEEVTDFTKMDCRYYDEDDILNMVSKGYIKKVKSVYDYCYTAVNAYQDDIKSNWEIIDIPNEFLISQLAECLMGLAIIETGNTEENPYDLSWYDFACKDLYDNDDTDMYEVCMAVIQDYPALYEKICRMVKPFKLSLYAYWNLVHIWESPDFNMNESYRQKRYTSLFEAKALTPEEKMDRWHNGTRKENIKACNIDKLKEYRKICRAKGYTEQVKLINAELKRRKDEGINESQLPSRGINLQPGGEFYNMDKNTFMSIYDMLVKKYGEDRIIYNKLGYGIVTLWLDEIGPNGYEIIFWSELGTLIDVDLLRHLLPGSIFV